MCFTKIYGPREKYFVLVQDGEINVISFEVQQDKRGTWKIAPPAPEWVYNLEYQIADAILESNATEDDNELVRKAS